MTRFIVTFDPDARRANVARHDSRPLGIPEEAMLDKAEVCWALWSVRSFSYHVTFSPAASYDRRFVRSLRYPGTLTFTRRIAQ